MEILQAYFRYTLNILHLKNDIIQGLYNIKKNVSSILRNVYCAQVVLQIKFSYNFSNDMSVYKLIDLNYIKYEINVTFTRVPWLNYDKIVILIYLQYWAILLDFVGNFKFPPFVLACLHHICK